MPFNERYFRVPEKVIENFSKDGLITFMRLTIGHDSEVYKIQRNTGTLSVLKFYKRSLSLYDLQLYKKKIDLAIVNLKTILKKNDISKLLLGLEKKLGKVVSLKIIPIDSVFQTDDGFTCAESKYIPGSNVYDLAKGESGAVNDDQKIVLDSIDWLKPELQELFDRIYAYISKTKYIPKSTSLYNMKVKISEKECEIVITDLASSVNLFIYSNVIIVALYIGFSSVMNFGFKSPD